MPHITEPFLADGLLEQPVLRLGPHRPPAPQPLAKPDGTVVGLVRWQPKGPFWSRFVPGLRLAVHEIADEPLLFTLHRSWEWRAWHEVRDADDRHVGWILDVRLWDRFGDRLARREGGQFLGDLSKGNRPILAEWFPADAGGELHFRRELDPFSKMLVLAAALLAAGA